jgi:GNAT superfamily N-acetyltransferase
MPQTLQGPLVIRPLGRPGDLGWVVMAHGEMYAQEFGWDSSFEALVARIVADYAATADSKREQAWIAEIDGRRIGCIFCVAASPTMAKLRILLVDPTARGRGVGGTLVDTCVDFARAAGYQQIQLWTNQPLLAARRIYLERGFVVTNEKHHQSFGADLLGQIYERSLV